MQKPHNRTTTTAVVHSLLMHCSMLLLKLSGKNNEKERERDTRLLLSIHHFQFKSFINGNLKPPQWCSLFMLINNFKSFSGCTNILYIMSTTNWLISNWMVNETIYCIKIEIECSSCSCEGEQLQYEFIFHWLDIMMENEKKIITQKM